MATFVQNKDIKDIAEKLEMKEGVTKVITEKEEGSLVVEFVDDKTDIRYSATFSETEVGDTKASTHVEIKISKPSPWEEGERVHNLDVYKTNPLEIEQLFIIENNLRESLEGFGELVGYFNNKITLLKIEDTDNVKEITRFIIMNMGLSIDLINNLDRGELPNIFIEVYDEIVNICVGRDKHERAYHYVRGDEELTDFIAEIREGLCEAVVESGIELNTNAIFERYKESLEGITFSTEGLGFSLSTPEFESFKDGPKRIQGKLNVSLDITEGKPKNRVRVERIEVESDRITVEERSFFIKDILDKALQCRSVMGSFLNSDVVREYKETCRLDIIKDKVTDAYDYYMMEENEDIERPVLSRFYSDKHHIGLRLAGDYFADFRYLGTSEEGELGRFVVSVGLLGDGKFKRLSEELITFDEFVERVLELQYVFDFDELKERIEGTDWTFINNDANFLLINEEKGVAFEIRMDEELGAFRAEFFSQSLPGTATMAFRFEEEFSLGHVLRLVLEEDNLRKFEACIDSIEEAYRDLLPTQQNVGLNEVDETSYPEEEEE